MKTLDEIKSTLSDIQTSLEIEGPAVDIQVELLARSIYENEVNNVAEILNSSLNRSTNLSSLITHSMDRGYSVFRGQNQRLRVSNIRATITKSVSKFDIAGKIGAYYLVYANDYQFTSGEEPEDDYIELIICNEVLVSSKSIDIENEVILDFTTNYISEDIILSSAVDEESTIVSHYSTMGDVIANGGWLVLTAPGYSIRVFNPDVFSYGTSVTLKYLKYTRTEVEPEALTSLNGFEQLDSDTPFTVVSVDYIDPLSDKNKIRAYANRYWLSNKLVRSTLDMGELFKELLVETYGAYDVLVKWTLDSDTDIFNISVYYTRDSALTSDDQTSITNEMKLAYYIPADITYTLASNTDVVRPLSSSSSYFIITVYYTESIPGDEINEVIDKYENNISDRSFNIFRFLADLQEIDNIKYCDLSSSSTTCSSIGINNTIFTLSGYDYHIDLSTIIFEYIYYEG